MATQWSPLKLTDLLANNIMTHIKQGTSKPTLVLGQGHWREAGFPTITVTVTSKKLIQSTK